MYIVFEGVDGSGKSTQLELVRKRLEEVFGGNGYDIGIVTMCEPELEDVVDVDDAVELTLRFALQRRLLHKKFPSKIFFNNVPTIVLSDRSFYSSLAYQGRNSGRGYVECVNSFVHKPSMVFFFDNGVCDDSLLERVREEYFNVLPLHTIHVDTCNYSVDETTDFICKEIIGKWKELFENKDNMWRF